MKLFCTNVTPEVNPQNWQSADLRLAFRHRPDGGEKLSLRQGAGNRAVYSDVGHGSHRDVGDGDFDATCLRIQRLLTVIGSHALCPVVIAVMQRCAWYG
jgi:hypothetical protein